jgi:hypothetical protein
MELSLSTPTLLFPAISLLLLAYTNRFLALASLIRNLHSKFDPNSPKKKILEEQLTNLRLRIKIIKYMQGLGVLSILLCVFCIIALYLGLNGLANVIFVLSLLVFASSLMLSLTEINMSTKALEIELRDMEL